MTGLLLSAILACSCPGDPPAKAELRAELREIIAENRARFDWGAIDEAARQAAAETDRALVARESKLELDLLEARILFDPRISQAAAERLFRMLERARQALRIAEEDASP